MSKLYKRKWDGLETIKEGKWFTGYDGDVTIIKDGAEHPHLQWCTPCGKVDHYTKTLTLRPVCTSRGRSSAVMVWEDKDGFQYNMSLSGGFKLLQMIVNNKVELDLDKGYVTQVFTQTKQGANYFIEVYDE